MDWNLLQLLPKDQQQSIADKALRVIIDRAIQKLYARLSADERVTIDACVKKGFDAAACTKVLASHSKTLQQYMCDEAALLEQRICETVE